MKLSQLCIERPVLATVLSLLIIVLGLLGYQQLEIRFIPKVFHPHLNIITTYNGASAALVERTVTDKLENALAGTPNLDSMHSVSQEGWSRISLNFKTVSQEQFILAQSQVLQQISSITLPPAADKPKLRSGGEENFVMMFGFSDQHMSSLEVGNYVNQNILKQLQQVPGVAEIQLMARPPAMRISLKPLVMAKKRITVTQVLQALDANNVSVPAGDLVNQDQVIPVNANLKLTNVDAFKNIVITRQAGGHLVRLSDIATVAIGDESVVPTHTQVNGVSGAALQIFSTDDANPIQVGKLVTAKLKQLQRGFPPGMKTTVLFNLSSILLGSVKEVISTILIAIVLVSLVCLLFLGRPRVALIPVVTIPVCLIGTFTIMYLMGASINVLTLLALVLAVGMVVDDAIVVLENCHRHIEAGMKRLDASRKSMREISFAVIGMTISLLAVYIPTAFMKGHTAIYFREFAFTLAGSILISGFVALTLTPMMCAQILPQKGQSRYENWLDRVFHRCRSGYQAILSKILVRRKWVVVAFVVLLVCGGVLFRALPSTLFPQFDASLLFGFLAGPSSANATYIHNINEQAVARIRKEPYVDSILNFTGGSGNFQNFGHIFIHLKPWYERSLTTDQASDKINKILAQFPGISGGTFSVGPFSNISQDQGGGEISFHVVGLADYPQLGKAIDNLVKVLKKNPAIGMARSQLTFDDQQIDLSVNRQKAATLGVPIENITQTLSTMIGGPELVSQYIIDDQAYPIVVQTQVQDLKDLSVLKKVYVQSQYGTSYPLSEFITAKTVFSIKQCVHLNQLRSADVAVDPAPGYTIGQVVNVINAAAKTHLPNGMQVLFTGQVKQMLQSNDAMLLIFVSGIIFIYLILAALFESFIDPLIILLTVPLCIVGALYALYMIHGSLNIYTGLGLVTLIGLIAKHGILITNFANQRRQAGDDLTTAILSAASIRLRPILMTTATMVLGALPLILAAGPGSNSRGQLGWVIIAGLLIGTFFSLFVVPVAYSLLNSLKSKRIKV